MPLPLALACHPVVATGATPPTRGGPAPGASQDRGPLLSRPAIGGELLACCAPRVADFRPRLIRELVP